MAVSVKAAFAGQADIAYGNVVGSNIFNVLFILGLSALVAPLLVDRQLMRRDVPIMIGASLLLPVLALDGRIGRLDGALLFAGIVGLHRLLGGPEPEGERRQARGDSRGDAGRADRIVVGEPPPRPRRARDARPRRPLARGRRRRVRPVVRRLRARHRPDDRRGRDVAPRGRDVRPRRLARPPRDRRRERRRVEHLQHPGRPRPDAASSRREASRSPRPPSPSTRPS